MKLFDGPRFKKTADELSQQPYGTHADEIEVSLMLAIAPELVDMTRAEPMPFFPAGPARGPALARQPGRAELRAKWELRRSHACHSGQGFEGAHLDPRGYGCGRGVNRQETRRADHEDATSRHVSHRPVQRSGAERQSGRDPAKDRRGS
ncbi:MAG: creatininase family protein [Methyloceanibacter sp.]